MNPWRAGRAPAPAAAFRRRFPAALARLGALLLLALLAAGASGTTVVSALTGQVVSGSAPVAGVSVSVESEALQGSRVTVTGPSGLYVLEALPPGSYELTFSKTGLQTLSRPVVVELGRVARADVRLEPSDEDETVTSTVKDVDVSRTTAVTTHFSGEELDRLPLPRTAKSIAALSPGLPRSEQVDGVAFAGADLLGEDLLAEATVLRAAVPPPQVDFFGGVLALRTKHPAAEPHATVRDTISNGGWMSSGAPSAPDPGARHLVEASAGGPLLRDRLRGFASFWTGDSAERALEDLRGTDLRLTALVGASHVFDAHYLDVQRSGHGAVPGASLASLRYTGTPGEWTTVDAIASTSSEGVHIFGPPGIPPSLDLQGEDTLTARVSHVLPARAGDHVLSAGAIHREVWLTDRAEGLSFRTLAFFAGDRWMSGRWTVDAALQHQRRSSDLGIFFGGDSNTTLPRAAVAFDLTGNGRYALSASHTAFDEGRSEGTMTRVSSFGYAMAFGSSGLARVDLLRVSLSGAARNELQAEGRYRLFDRYDAGATYTLSPDGTAGIVDYRHVANGWLGAEIPFGPNTFGVTVLQRYASTQDGARELTTAAGLRYTWPVARLRVTAALDASGLLRHGELATDPRTVRAWIRMGL